METLTTELLVPHIATEANIMDVEAPMRTDLPQEMAQTHLEPSNFGPTHIADLAREVQIGTYTVASTATVGASYSLSVLYALYNALQSNAIVNYEQFRYKSIRIRVVPIGSAPVLSGAVRISALSYDGFNNSPYVDDYRHSTLNNTVIPFSRNTELDMVIPWFYPRAAIRSSVLSNQAGAINMGVGDPAPRLTFTVAIPLINAALSACSVNFVIYAKFEDPELLMYTGRNPGAIGNNVPVFTAAIQNTWTLSTTHAYGKGDQEAKEKSEKGVVSGVAGTVKKIADAASSIIPNPISPLVSMAAGVAGTIADFFGFDKPANVDASSHVQMRFGDDAISLDGLDASVKLNLAQDITDDFETNGMGASCNDAIVQKYASKFGLVGVLSDTGTATYPNALGTFAVTPAYNFQNTGITLIHRPPMSMASCFFTRWRGDIKFRVHAHLDMFSDAQIYAIISTTDTVTPLYLPSPKMIRKVSGSTVFEFTVPYINFTDWAILNATDSPYRYKITIGLVDAVRRQGVPIPATFLVEMAASDEAGRFEVAEPRTMSLAYGNYLLNLTPTPLGKNRNSAITPVRSLIDLFKRYTWLAQLGVASSTVHFAPQPATNTLSLFLSMFAAFRGSTRLRCYLYNGETCRVFLQPSLMEKTVSQNFTLSGFVPRYEDYNPEIALEVHYDSEDYFGTYVNWWNNTISYYGSVQFVFSNTPTGPTQRDFFVALGDDFFVAQPFATPLLTASGTFFASNVVPKNLIQKAQTEASSSLSSLPYI